MEMTFSYKFEAAHRFTHGNSKCATPHGHTWWVELSLSHSMDLIKPEINFSWDFADIKKEWKSFIDGCLDHSFICNQDDPLLTPLLSLNSESRILRTPGDPTTEVLALLFFKKAKTLIKKFEGVKVSSIRLKETATNSVLLNEKDFDAVDFSWINEDRRWWNHEDPLFRS